ncbi:MAG: hypothetical protein AAF903_14815, partial [Pseudomonadota bacterium]
MSGNLAKLGMIVGLMTAVASPPVAATEEALTAKQLDFLKKVAPVFYAADFCPAVEINHRNIAAGAAVNGDGTWLIKKAAAQFIQKARQELMAEAQSLPDVTNRDYGCLVAG